MSTPIVFITGANTGLGLEIVKALFRSSKAYTILLGGRSIENAEAAAYQVREEYPNSSAIAVPIQIDIEDDESIEKACDYIRSHYARVDVLINNAGKAAINSDPVLGVAALNGKPFPELVS
jgi:NADP-dependent 3-hydroxy acid dehydrogenase YdfG